MSDDTNSTPVPNVGANARSGIDHEKLTPREPSTLAGHPSNRRMPDAEDVDLGRQEDTEPDQGGAAEDTEQTETEESGEPEVLRGEALEEAVRAANEDGAGIPTSASADERRAALAEYQASQ